MHYVTRTPSEPLTETAPTIVILHGYGANEDDLMPVASYFPPSLKIISLQAPIELEMGGYSWYHLEQSIQGLKSDIPSRLESETIVKNALPDILRKENADLNNIFLMGFSQGAAMCYSLLANNDFASQGITIRGVIAMSGYVPRDMIELLSLKHLSNFPVFISHGEFDDVVPPIALDEAEKILTKTGANVTANIYDIGHGIDMDVIRDLQRWLASLAVVSG